MSKGPLIPPYKGAANFSTYSAEQEGFAPLESIGNLIPFTAEKDRAQVGTRWGTEKLFSLQLAGAVQSFCTAERSAGQTGLQVGNQVAVDGTSRIAGTLTGHCFCLDATLSMFAGFRDPRAVGAAAFIVRWHPTLPKVVFGTIYDNAGKVVTGLSMGNTATNTVDWIANCEDRDTTAGAVGSNPIYGNQVAVHPRYTFVAAVRYLYVFLTSDGTFLKRYDLDGWSFEAMSVAVEASGDSILVGFWGTTKVDPAGLPNQPALAHTFGSGDVRSGVMRFEVVENDAQPLIRVRLGTGLASTDPWFENDHGYLRLAEVLGRYPHGAIPYALAAGPDGDFAVGMTNQGWGWNSTLPPNGSKPYRTIAVFESDGSLRWEVDTNSRRVAYTRGGLTGAYNDIPEIDADDDIPPTGTPKPSINALAFDTLGNVYGAGQRTSAGFNVFKLSADTGSKLWEYDAGSMVEQHAISIDPTDNNLWVAVMRNNSWTGHTANAILIKLNTLDGSVLASYDVTPNPINGAWMCHVSPRGEVAFVVDYLS